LMSAFPGIVLGLFPASEASSLNPIDSPRYMYPRA
jgi:hypothetical protein